MNDRDQPMGLSDLVERLAVIVTEQSRAILAMRVTLGTHQTALKLLRENLIASGTWDDGAVWERLQMAIDLTAEEETGEGRQHLDALRTQLKALLSPSLLPAIDVSAPALVH